MTDSNSAAPADTAETAAPATQKRRGRPVDPNSALSQARAVFASLPAGSTRKDAIAAFQASVKSGTELVSKETAAAYYALIQRGNKADASTP